MITSWFNKMRMAMSVKGVLVDGRIHKGAPIQTPKVAGGKESVPNVAAKMVLSS